MGRQGYGTSLAEHLLEVEVTGREPAEIRNDLGTLGREGSRAETDRKQLEENIN